MEQWDGNKKIFSGYYRGSGKRPSEKIKDTPGHSFTEVSASRSFGAKLYSGVVDISFDDKEMSQRFLDIADVRDWRCLVLENPDNGHIHTYWRDPAGTIEKSGKDIKLACGLVADIHMGSTYIPLKVDGVERFPPVYDINEGEEYQAVPTELLPVNTEVTLWKSSGRNDDSFRYILILQSQLFMSPDDIRDMYRNVINPYIFESPLEDSELNVILRDEAFEKTDVSAFYVGKSFKFDIFAEYLKEKYHIVIINDQLHLYDDGCYYPEFRQIEKRMVREIPQIKDTQRKEVMKYLNLICEPVEPASPRYIAFTNGVYDVEDDVIHELSPDFIITNKIPWDYNPEAYDPFCDRTLDRLSCGDTQIRALLEECMGSCLYRDHTLDGGKAFILTGEKANGKSTYLDTVRTALGSQNVSALDLSEIGGERFSSALLFGKLANIGDDISDNFLQGKEVSVFKKIVTGNRIKAEQKGQDPFEFNPYCKLLFSANDIPRMRDKTGAVIRRLIIIPFNATFTRDDPDYDENAGKKLASKDSIEYLLRLGVGTLRRVREHGFTKSTLAMQELNEYEEENNPIIGFINDQGDQILNQPTSEVYRRYQLFCAETGMQSMSRIVFSKQICREIDANTVLKRINGKPIRIFMKEEA